MTPEELLDALALVRKASAEQTKRAIQLHTALKVDETIVVRHKAEDCVFRAFGHKGIDAIRMDAATCGRSAAKAAELRDHYDWRKVEIATEMLAAGLIAKPYLKAAEFTYLIKPWADVLPEELRSTEGCESDEPPPPPQQIRNVTAKERKRQDKALARDKSKQQREQRREERRVARAEKRSAQQRAQDKLAAKARGGTATGSVAGNPTEAALRRPELSEDDLVSAALGLTEVSERPSPPPREQREPIARSKDNWAIPPDNQVRALYAKRDQRWWLVMPEGSNARVCAEKFGELVDAQTFALEKGWTVVRVQGPQQEAA